MTTCIYMGAIFKLNSLTSDNFNKLMTPHVFCVDKTKITSYTKDYLSISINGVLSKRLMKYEHNKRALFITDEFNTIIDQEEGSLLIENFEVLFTPEYQIDVIKLFILANRRKKIAVLWSGQYKNGELLFAKPEYEDYKSYKIKDYDISCII